MYSLMSMYVWLSCVCIHCYIGQLTCGREWANVRISASTITVLYARRFLFTRVVIYTVKSEVCFLFSFQEQKQIVLCLVHQLIFIQYGRKLMPLKEAPILGFLFLLINMETRSTFVRQQSCVPEVLISNLGHVSVLCQYCYVTRSNTISLYTTLY
jgi:hypothetical protein